MLGQNRIINIRGTVHTEQSQRKTTGRGSRMQRRRLQDVGDAAETR